MKKYYSYKDTVALIQSLHSFFDESENRIANFYANYTNKLANIKTNKESNLQRMKQVYVNQQKSVKDKCKKMIEDAQSIYNDIINLEKDLMADDKYFVKQKEKREEILVQQGSDKYKNFDDYFKTLSDIRIQFKDIVTKYKNRKHRWADGINFMMSKTRKSDYEELILLKISVRDIIDEMNKDIPELSKDSLAAIDDDYCANTKGIEDRYNAELKSISASYNAGLESLADSICDTFDSILPDSLVDNFGEIKSEYQKKFGNIDVENQNIKNIVIGYINYPYKDMIESSILTQLIESKCEKIIENRMINFPLIVEIGKDFNFVFDCDKSASFEIEKFTHSIFMSFLSYIPVSNLNICVIDPENRGKSILPFLELKKKMPEIFYGKVLTTQEEIREQMFSMRNYEDLFIQEKLGNRFSDFNDYIENNPKSPVPITLMLLYDFPIGFDETNISEIKNIIKNGSKCGIYTLICKNSDGNNSYYNIDSKLSLVYELCDSFRFNGNSFTINSLELSYKSIPASSDLNSFIDKYSFICEQRKNKDMVLPVIAKRLIGTRDSEQIKNYFSEISRTIKIYDNYYGKIIEGGIEFPGSIMLGNIKYPYELFSEDVVNNSRKLGLISADDDKNISIPFTCELNDNLNIYVKSDNSTNQMACELSHSLILSFLSQLPYGKINIVVMDSDKRGNSIIPFLDFRKKMPDLFNSQIFTTKDAIYEKLNNINNYIDSFIQNKLGNNFSNFYEINTKSNQMETLQLLVIYDFPKDFENRTYELLLNILKNGNKCGIFTIMINNSDVLMSRYDKHDEYIAQVEKFCSCFEIKNEKFYLYPYNCQFEFNKFINNSEFADFYQGYAREVESVKNKGLSFDDVVAKNLFSMDAQSKLSIPIGVGFGDTVVNLDFGKGSSHHGLIAGATGSGKSTLLHTIIMSAMLNYSPEQLNLYLMDFKSGTEFKIYESVKLPHIKLIALDALQEFGESILENLVAEMNRRGELFKKAGQTGLKSYYEATGEMLPRILVVMDEFQILFNDSTNRKVAMNCGDYAKKIVTEGRAFGIHLIMATQSTKIIRDLTLSNGTIEQMRIRIGLKCNESDAQYLFPHNYSEALELMKGPIGTAVINEECNEESNVGFRVAYCDKETQKRYLEFIANQYSNLNMSPQIFEGNRFVSLIDYFRNNNVMTYDAPSTKIYLGDKIKVAPTFTMDIDRRKKYNVLICGTSERMLENITNQFIVSALLNRNNLVYSFDGDIIVGDNSSEFFYKVYENNPNLKIPLTRNQIVDSIHDIYDIFKGNMDSGTGSKNVFIVIKNLQWIDIIQKMFRNEYTEENKNETIDPFDFTGKKDDVSSMLIKMLDEGSSYGIYFVITANEYTVVKETLYYDRLLAKINHRIIFSLNDNDADNLIDGVSVAGLKDGIVYYTDGVKNTFQFKPFVIDKDEELKEYLEEIK